MGLLLRGCEQHKGDIGRLDPRYQTSFFICPNLISGWLPGGWDHTVICAEPGFNLFLVLAETDDQFANIEALGFDAEDTTHDHP